MAKEQILFVRPEVSTQPPVRQEEDDHLTRLVDEYGAYVRSIMESNRHRYGRLQKWKALPITILQSFTAWYFQCIIYSRTYRSDNSIENRWHITHRCKTQLPLTSNAVRDGWF